MGGSVTRILLLDRRAEAQEWFKARFLTDHLDWTTEPDVAIHWLAETGTVYDFFFTVQDLGHEPQRPGEVGRKVTLWLCAHPEVQRQMRTVIHTGNDVSGPKMERELRAAGRRAKWVPWSRLRDTFDLVLELVEDTGPIVTP